MDNEILKKRLSTYRSDKDRLSNLPPEVLQEALSAWEQWTGKSKDFYASIGVSHRQMAGILGKAKKLRREGHFPGSEFKEIQIEATASSGGGFCGPSSGIELSWEAGKVIRFSQVEQLVDFLKKVA